MHTLTDRTTYGFSNVAIDVPKCMSIYGDGMDVSSVAIDGGWLTYLSAYLPKYRLTHVGVSTQCTYSHPRWICTGQLAHTCVESGQGPPPAEAPMVYD